MFWLKQRHPRRAIGLFEVAAGGQRRAAIEDADVVEAEEAAFEDVLAEAVFAVHPPREVQQQLVERRRQKLQVHLAAQGLLGAMQKERGEGVHGRIHIAEIPFVGRHLAARVEIDVLEHQLHLLFGEIRIDDRERERVEGQIPRGIPRILPLVGHRDDVLVQHVEPFGVAGGAKAVMERVGIVLGEPVLAIEEEELLAPQHPGDGLPHDVSGIGTHAGRRHGLIKLIGFLQPIGQDFIEVIKRLIGRAGEPQANHLGLTGFNRDVVVRGGLRACLLRVHGVLPALHHVVVDAILDVGTFVRLLAGEQPLVIGFVLGEEQRHVALAG